MDDKKDAKTRAMALVTVPISIISGPLSFIAGITGIAVIGATSAEADDSPETAEQTALPKPKLNSQDPSSSVSNASQLTYTVRTGDTISSISRRFQISNKQLLKINKLETSSILKPGQKLKLISDSVSNESPSSKSLEKLHTVKRGETISSIAKSFGVSVTTVLAMNKLSAKAIIFPGQRLNVGSVITKKPTPVIPSEHTVLAGETLATVAKLYGLKLTVLLQANTLTESSLVFTGQKLKLKLGPQSLTPAESPTESPALAKKPAGAQPLSGGLSSKDPHRPSNVCQVHGFHTVKTGESISRIALVYGLTTQSVLAANALTWSEMIFVGQRIVIPGVHEIKYCPELTPLTPEMRSNAKVIHRIGKTLGVSDYGIVIALATAMQESGIRNLTYGDRDSVGLFQQRPSAHWGSANQIMDPEYSARAFFGGKTSPTFGAARGLLDIKDWATKSLTQAAQAVQISAYPNAYAKWEQSAWVWFDELENANSDA